MRTNVTKCGAFPRSRVGRPRWGLPNPRFRNCRSFLTCGEKRDVYNQSLRGKLLRKAWQAVSLVAWYMAIVKIEFGHVSLDVNWLGDVRCRTQKLCYIDVSTCVNVSKLFTLRPGGSAIAALRWQLHNLALLGTICVTERSLRRQKNCSYDPSPTMLLSSQRQSSPWCSVWCSYDVPAVPVCLSSLRV